ncbi:C-GCAxxG-C-C family (seleno)protein [Geoalkalibacter halelectricus]|uniref:C-GCAxxG-C-C family (seleno)protein n=1 Tax=Geoalkalibacter halelectricus TaxID=2847045 RepID=UPI003D1CE066
MDKDRRKVLGMAGCMAAAGVLGTGAFRLVGAQEDKKDEPKARPPVKLDDKGKVLHEVLPYVALDPDEALKLSYSNKLIGDCMYGVFATVVEMLADKVGGAYLTYPTSVTRFGAGGIVGWGATCGSVQGAAMAIYLVSPNPTPIIDEVLNYYQYTMLPDLRPPNAAMDIKPSRADSTLCHVSISHWTKASGAKTFSKERVERCAQLAANLTKKTVEALNAQLAGSFKADFPIPEEVVACRACHDMGGAMENTRGKMNCLTCHSGHDELKPNIYEKPPIKL